MKNVAILIAAVLLLTPSLHAARKKDGPLPPFQIGVTGIMARPAKGTFVPVTVAEVTPGTPAAGKLRADDVLVAVNGTTLGAPDPRPGLGRCEHRNSHVLTSFGPDTLVLVADQVNQLRANMGDPAMVEGRKGGVALWILIGDKWGGEGLLSIIEKMDENDRAGE